MKLFVYESAYKLEEYDKGTFTNYSEYVKSIANIISCFNDNNIIVFPIEENIFYDDEYEFNRSFIKDRIIFRNDSWIYNTPSYVGSSPTFIWYVANNKDDIIDALNIDQSFNCAIIPHKGNIEEAIYILNSNEDDEVNSLSIREKNTGDFLKKVVPSLELYLREKIEIIDLK